jgi:hypothetical protein
MIANVVEEMAKRMFYEKNYHSEEIHELNKEKEKILQENNKVKTIVSTF